MDCSNKSSRGAVVCPSQKERLLRPMRKLGVNLQTIHRNEDVLETGQTLNKNQDPVKFCTWLLTGVTGFALQKLQSTGGFHLEVKREMARNQSDVCKTTRFQGTAPSIGFSACKK